MRSKSGIFTLVLIILICITFLPSQSAFAQGEEMQKATLYYGSNYDLVTGESNETQSQTFTYGPSLMVLATDVGVWSTGPLAKSLHISGGIDTAFWASGSGVVYFEIRLNVNGEYTGIILTSGSLPLSSSPQEISSSESAVDIQLAAGDIFEVDVSIYLLGTTVNIYWGSAEHPSNIILPCNSVDVGTPGFKMNAGSEKVTVNATVVSAFGDSDIANCSINFQGPSDAEHITELDHELENGSIVIIWVWEYGKDKTGEGQEYTVLISVVDNSGNSWSSNASEPIKLKMGGGGGGPGGVVWVIVLLLILGVVGFIMYRRKFK
jgi:hypothetical protein